jgi:diaminopimelate epimerase
LRALLPFTKYHGLGNDFVLIDARELVFDPALAPLLANWKTFVQKLAPRLCDRHHGVGADGIILAMPLYGASETEPFEAQFKSRSKKATGEFPARHSSSSETAGAAFLATEYKKAVTTLTADYPQVDSCDLSWVYTNSDGSSAVMCGNGLRCLALWARLRGGVEDRDFMIATAKGAVAVQITDDKRICVDVGQPVLEAQEIPVRVQSGPTSGLIKLDLVDGGVHIPVIAVGMGNPHGVIFDDSVWEGWQDAVDLQGEPDEKLKEPDHLDGGSRQKLLAIAQFVQSNPAFPQGVNVEFVQVVSRELVRCYVYERGCGFTLACASGAAAVVVAGVLAGILEPATRVQLPGGTLEIAFTQSDDRVRITGPASEIFSGVFKLELLDGLELCSDTRAEANCK